MTIHFTTSGESTVLQISGVTTILILRVSSMRKFTRRSPLNRYGAGWVRLYVTCLSALECSSLDALSIVEGIILVYCRLFCVVEFHSQTAPYLTFMGEQFQGKLDLSLIWEKVNRCHPLPYCHIEHYKA